ncbi:hypothetical protein GCM10010329_28110 [Streptomyces spiroverticillatus]|uniref:Protein phosphatase n=1 Tax=Streptomyces finlayi TaxID=67296 RepID=A0A918WVR7_9ACTN|nr:hypothetical protein [Streptomyces finlayi]GHA03957.1 hypothetical protein GCM10010329_28110 [Streptomyces spiroverticillatus]GHC88087.1 hypothetical protein GCM10010334_20520 [Streptomyces finlayi]
MSDSTPVSPSGIPQFTGNLATLERQVTALRKDGTQLAAQGKSTHTAFQGLSAYYQAPEADRLFATTAPVSTTAHDIGTDLGTVADALDTYATAVRPLAKRLAELKADAQAFANAAAADDTWREDGDKVEENNDRRDEIARTLEAFWTAEIECHSKIVNLVGGETYKLNDGSKSDHLYGYRADDLKGAKGLPWGDPVVESVRWYQSYEYVADFATGVVVDGVWGTVKGLGTLVGVDGWDKAGEAWTGLAKLATGIAMIVVPAGAIVPALVGGDTTRKWLMDSQTALKETGKALVAWDQWGSNPGRAAGAVTFNVVTTVFTGGVGAGVSGAGKAGAVAKALSVAGKAGRIIDPATYVFKAGVYGGTKIRDLFAGFKDLGRADAALPPGVIELPEGTLRNADGTVTLPADATPPKGAVEQPNGTYTLTDDAVPAGSIKATDGSDAYLTPKGDVVNGKGEVLSEAENAPVDVVDNAATRTDTPAATSRTEPTGDTARADAPEVPDPERVLVSVGADTTRAVPEGSGQLGDTARTGGNVPDHPPRMGHDGTGGGGGTGGTSPGDTLTRGGARDLAGNGAGDLPRGGATGPDAPGGPHGDGPGGGGPGGGYPDDLSRADDAAPDGAADLSRNAENQPDDGAATGDRSGTAERRLTPAELKALQDKHVWLANNDPAWRRAHYHTDGHRVSRQAKVDGVHLPILRKLDDGTFVAKSEIPHGPTEFKYDRKPLAPSTADARHLPKLHELAKGRRLSLELTNAELALKSENPPAAAHSDLVSAREDYVEHFKDTPNNSQHAERLGEGAARLHAIPTLFKDAEWIDLPKTANGADALDALYKLKSDGSYLVVEEKGPAATLNPPRHGAGPAAGMMVQQGTHPYLQTIFQKMWDRGGAERLLADDLFDALENKRVKYVLVTAREKNGSYDGAVLDHLKIY